MNCLENLFDKLRHTHFQGEGSRVADAIYSLKRTIIETFRNSRVDLSARELAILVCSAVTGFRFESVETCFRDAGWKPEDPVRRVDTLIGSGGRRSVSTEFPFPGLRVSLEGYLESVSHWMDSRSKDTLKHLLVAGRSIPTFCTENWSDMCPMCESGPSHQRVWSLFFARFFPKLRDSQVQSLVENATQARRDAADRAFVSSQRVTTASRSPSPDVERTVEPTAPPVPPTPPPQRRSPPKKVDPPLKSDGLRMLSAANAFLERPRVEYFDTDLTNEIKSELNVVRVMNARKTQEGIAALTRVREYKNAYVCMRNELMRIKPMEAEAAKLRDEVNRLNFELKKRELDVRDLKESETLDTDRVYENLKSAYKSLQSCMLISSAMKRRRCGDAVDSNVVAKKFKLSSELII